MTAEEFYAFTDTLSDDEKWELIEGEPILNASPSQTHQWLQEIFWPSSAIENARPGRGGRRRICARHGIEIVRG
jgi:hypothetical protein